MFSITVDKSTSASNTCLSLFLHTWYFQFFGTAIYFEFYPKKISFSINASISVFGHFSVIQMLTSTEMLQATTELWFLQHSVTILATAIDFICELGQGQHTV